MNTQNDFDILVVVDQEADTIVFIAKTANGRDFLSSDKGFDMVQYPEEFMASVPPGLSVGIVRDGGNKVHGMRSQALH